MHVLGVTGSMGSGKSTVSTRLGEHGAMISHSDDLARFLLENDADILARLRHRFGDDIIDESKSLKRALLAKRAFANRENQQFLNQLIHPKVWQATQKRIETARERGYTLFVIDAPLLFEAGVDVYTDSTLVVTADLDVRRKRIWQRSNISADDFDRREALQMPIEKKIKQADYVIENNDSLEELEIRVDDFYLQLKL